MDYDDLGPSKNGDSKKPHNPDMTWLSWGIDDDGVWGPFRGCGMMLSFCVSAILIAMALMCIYLVYLIYRS